MPEPTSPPPLPPPDPAAPERLSLRWALILLAAIVAGLVAGLLTFARTHNWPAAVMAALAASGAALVGLPPLV
ncbi:MULTISPECIES: hypothetical protein [Streptomyces]|uniref:hypothetical protein n=1 Tax=Streptomyces TaxID=1883 RepID=UPI002943859E|nr:MULTISPECIES: hypothetical protein [Streptomyces]MDX2591419.1 hypothetical protein [Streptomyces sp. WI03-4A]